MSNLVEIIVTAKNLTGPALAGVNAEVSKAGKGMAMFHKTAGLAAAGLVAIGVESVKMASKFDSEMTLLQTQAGVSADKIGGLKKGVLSLAGKVGQDPDSLAESLFHVESNFESMGITSAKALKLTETAAKGATVGHADLVDVTNALTAAVASGIPGVENFDQAMGVLNATVGVGDMKMQDLASAFGSGMVATVKGFGLNIKDVGAALAVFGDNNIRGALAGNQLRMSVMALAKPVAGGAATLKSLGLQADTLAKDMQKGGLKLALEDLVAHMKAAGISSKEQGAVITEAFGRKAGAGLNILVGQIDRLESKYPALDKGAKNFSQSWEDTKKTFAFQMKSLETGFQAFLIGVGQKIIPPLQAFIGFLKEHKSAAIGATEAMGGLLGVMLAFSASMKVMAGVKLMTTGLGALAKQAALMEGSFIAAGGGVRGLTAAFGSLSAGAKLGVTVAAIGALALAVDHFSGGKKAPDVDRLATSLGNLGDKGKVTGELAASFGTDLSGLAKDIDKLNGKKDALDHFNDAMNTVFTLGMKGSNGPKQAKKDLDSIDKGLAQLVSSGHADQATAALAKLQKETGKTIPKDSLDDYTAALAGAKLESDLTAGAQGRFGDQAQAVQAKLAAQQDVVDGLTQSLQALDQVNQDAFGSQTKFEQAISDATQAMKDNGATLSLHSEKGRANRDALLSVAQATDDFTEKLDKQGATWDTIDSAYKRGYDSLVKSAMGMGDNRKQAEALAKSLLHLPQEIKVKGDIGDFEAKLSKAKADLAHAPKSKKVQLRADIAQLENAIRDAQAEVNSLTGKEILIRATYSVVGGKGMNIFHEGGGYASGGLAPMGQTAWVGEDGPELMQVTPMGTRILSNADSKRLAKLNGLKIPGYANGTLTKAQRAELERRQAEARRKAAQERAQAEHEARDEALGSLSISHFGRMAGFRSSSFENSHGLASGLGDLLNSLNEWSGRRSRRRRTGRTSRNSWGAGPFRGGGDPEREGARCGQQGSSARRRTS
jgi:TP901 family phage tail tape measure protein